MIFGNAKGSLKAAFLMFVVMLLVPVQQTFSEERVEGKERSEVKVDPSPKTVRACVIGGASMTKLWDEISKRFKAKTGYDVAVVSTGPRPKISKPFRRGEADVLTMHSGDITSNLVADGYGTNMRVWMRNDLVIVGPQSDPAGIKGMKDGADAFRRIAETRSAFVDSYGSGPREVSHNLWKKAGIVPRGDWVLKDESEKSSDILRFAESRNAYVVFGRIPFLFRKICVGSLEIMVEGDPAMHRPYVVMEANPKRFPDCNHEGARALSDFLLSEEIQTVLSTFGKEQYGGIPLFHPVWPYSQD